MIDRVHKCGRAIFGVLARPMRRAVDSAGNPLNHLGAMTVFFLWIVLVSGIWLLIFFRTSVSGAFESVEYLTREQWYLGGIMRSLHRYASDGAIVTIFLHITKEFVFDRYRSNRWFSWVSGVPLVWMMFILGITGYWLVWDQLAQFVALSSAELMDSIPIFTDSMAGNFLSDELLSNRFFTLMAFLHLIGLPIFLVLGIWLHVFRLNSPRINPPRRMMAATLITLLVLSAVFPAVSHPQADLALVPQVLRLDWFYMHVFPLIEVWSPGWVWFFLIAVSSVIVVAPWASSRPKEQPALVTLEFCNGCERCVDDCPFAAVEMVPRTDETNYTHQASVDPDLCISCGICVGSCPTATPFRSRGALLPGIDLPDRTAAEIRDDIVANFKDEPSPGVIVFACRADSQRLELDKAGIRCITVNCMGQLPPSYVDFALSRGYAEGVLLLGCQDGSCQYRFGAQWTQRRLARQRDPMLRRRVDITRVALGWQTPWSKTNGALEKYRRFQRSLEP